MSVKSKAAKAAWDLIIRQGTKLGASFPSYAPSLYKPRFGMPQTETAIIGSAKMIKSLANQHLNPLWLKYSEFFKQAGLTGNQLKVLQNNPKLINEIIKDPANWAGGVPGTKILVKGKQFKNGRFAKDKMVGLIDEAKQGISPLVKDMHATPYFGQANLNRTGMKTADPVLTDVFNEVYGANLSRTAANKAAGGKGVLDDIIRFEGLDPKKLKFMELKRTSLNALHRDAMYSKQFRNLAKITHGRKFKSKDELMSYLLSQGETSFNPGQLRVVGNRVMINFSPQFKSNYYTGGINARVLLKPSDPGKVEIIPNDVYDLFGSQFDRLISSGLGFKNQNLNLMAIKKVNIPDPSNWGKVTKGIERKIKAKNIKKAKEDDSLNTMIKRYGKKTTPDTPEFTPDNIYKNTMLTKKQMGGINQIVDAYDKTNIPVSRYVKYGTSAGLFASGTAYGVSKAAKGTKDAYDSYHAQANTELFRIGE